MEVSIFLAKLFGLYMIIMGLACILKYRILIRMMSDILKNLHSIYLLIIAQLIVGLALVLNHNIWVVDWRLIITLISWISLIESVVYLILPHGVLMRVMYMFSTRTSFVLGGVLSVILGAYLAYIGFGFDFINFDFMQIGVASEKAMAGVINAVSDGMLLTIFSF